MLLGSRNLAVGDTRRYRVSYRDFLCDGVSISAVTVTIPNITLGYTSAIGTGVIAPELSPDRQEVYFWVVAGALNEAFTVQVQITDTNDQIVNDTIDLQVVSP